MKSFDWPEFLGAKPYIIAEVGSNWLHLDDCFESIRLAAKAGANAVKFQYFTAEDLYGYNAPGIIRRHLGSDCPELPTDWIRYLAEECKLAGVDFLCTVFNPHKVKDVDPYVKMHKVASAECNYGPLLGMLARTGKPILLSTGAHRFHEVQQGLDAIKINGDVPVCVMACVSAYPATNVNLFKIDALRKQFPKCKIGYSDHTTDAFYIPKAAIEFHGAVVLEKHFRLDAMNGTPDAGHSLTPVKFQDMVQYIKGAALIPVYEDRRHDEADMRLYHNRRQTARGFYREVKP